MPENRDNRSCAWCGNPIDESTNDSQVRRIILQHDICPDCALLVLSDHGYYLKPFLDGLDLPVILVDGDGRALTANRKFCRQTRKDLTAISDRLGGDIFECAYADLPGGCGHTLHCTACTVRMTVVRTLKTGQSQHRVPAYLHHHTPSAKRRVDYLISTEKIYNTVLLRIDQATPAQPSPLLPAESNYR